MRSATRQRFVLAAALLIGCLFVAGSARAQIGGTDATIDSGAGVVQNEISLAIVPSAQAGQPSMLLAAYNDNPGSLGLGVSYSTNYGATWNGIPTATPGQLPYPTPTLGGPILLGNVLDWNFDPTATADTQGRLFVAHIGVDSSDWGGVGGDNGLYVWRSTDNAQTWTQSAVSEVAAATSFPDYSYRFNDRCQITADLTSGGAYSNTDRVYIAWIQDRGYYDQSTAPPSGLPEGDIYFAYSNDNGVNFSAPLMLNQPTGAPLYLQEMGNMPIPCVAPNGKVYVSWLDYNVWTPSGAQGTIYLTSSTDGGVSFPTVTQGPTINLPPRAVSDLSLAPTGAVGAPVLAVSPSNANELYLVYAADPVGADEADIFFVRSINGGTSWNTPLRINTDATVTDQILPWIDVKPDGTIDIAWYDRRNDPGLDSLWDVFVTRSTDGGLTFMPQLAVNDQPFATPNNNWIGEYLALAVDSGYGYVAWTSSVTDLATGDVYFDSFANTAIVPEPSALLLAVLASVGLLAYAWRRRRHG